jgi:hypothetical protein
VPEIPDLIVLKRHRDLDGRDWQIWVRRGIFGLICLIPVLALFNLFGQRPQTTNDATNAAKLELYAPARVRSGLLYEARFTIRALRELKNATLVLDPGWAEGMTINTIEPSPVDEGSRNGLLLFKLGHVPAGEVFRLFMQFQVNPTNVGHRDQDVELFDGSARVATLHRTITVFP